MIAAVSGRALAASARRGGFVPLAVDRFGDLDMLAVAERHVQADMTPPLDADRLMAALESVTAGYEPIGLVCGTGFEDRGDLLTRFAARWRLLGNSADTVATLKDPIAFSGLCQRAGVPHPETSLTRPASAEGWLSKRIGGAGGWHIHAAGHTSDAEGIYFQRRAPGRAVSALLLGDGKRVTVLGFSAQWTAPAERHPYRYGGAMRPAPLTGAVRAALEAAIMHLCALVPLVGLNSADFLVDDEGFHLLEINPRPGATFDLFEPDEGSLFAAHVEACFGKLPERAAEPSGAAAGAILYADRPIASVPAIAWPDWTADRPAAGSRIGKDQPVCSVFARSKSKADVMSLLKERSAAIRALLGGAS